MWCDSGDDCGDDCGKDCCDSYDNSEYDRGDDPCDDCGDNCGDQGVFPRNLLARASAFQSVTIQVVDWQRRKWTAIVKLQAKSLAWELTLFYPCYNNQKNKRNNPQQNLSEGGVLEE